MGPAKTRRAGALSFDDGSLGTQRALTLSDRVRIVPLSVFAAREGADLSHGDLLYCYLRDRAHRGLMAVDSATTAGSQPQARSTAEDGRARVSCRARNARSAGEESRRPAVAGSRPASGRERIASLDPPAHAAEERRSRRRQSRMGSVQAPPPAMTAHFSTTASPARADKARFLFERSNAKGSLYAGCVNTVEHRADAASRNVNSIGYGAPLLVTPKIGTRLPTKRRSMRQAL